MLKATAFSSSLKLLKVFLQLEGNSHEENLIAYLHCKKTLEDKERKITCPWTFISFIKKEILFAWAAIITSTASNAYLHFYSVTEVWCFCVCSLGGCFLNYTYNVWCTISQSFCSTTKLYWVIPANSFPLSASSNITIYILLLSP